MIRRRNAYTNRRSTKTKTEKIRPRSRKPCPNTVDVSAHITLLLQLKVSAYVMGCPIEISFTEEEIFRPLTPDSHLPKKNTLLCITQYPVSQRMFTMFTMNWFYTAAQVLQMRIFELVDFRRQAVKSRSVAYKTRLDGGIFTWKYINL